MQTELVARLALEESGFHFSPSLGQNFLLSDEWNRRIADAAGVEPGMKILEFGPGAGTLTSEMASRGAEILALEIDRALEPVLGKVLAPYPNARVEFADALKADLESIWVPPYAVVANLPYYITSDLIERLLRMKNKPASISVLVQKEFAERLCARPGEKAYCALAALARYHGRTEALLDVPNAAFTPRPHVESRLIRMEIYEEKPVKPKDEELMLKLIAASFFMRRKTLVNNLCAVLGMGKREAEGYMEEAGLSGRIRGEALTIEELARLSDAISDTKI